MKLWDFGLQQNMQHIDKFSSTTRLASWDLFWKRSVWIIWFKQLCHYYPLVTINRMFLTVQMVVQMLVVNLCEHYTFHEDLCDNSLELIMRCRKKFNINCRWMHPFTSAADSIVVMLYVRLTGIKNMLLKLHNISTIYQSIFHRTWSMDEQTERQTGYVNISASKFLHFKNGPKVQYIWLLSLQTIS